MLFLARMKKLIPFVAALAFSCVHPSSEGRSYVPPASFGERDSALGKRMLTRLEQILNKHCEKSYANQNGFGCINYSLRYPDRDLWLWRCNYEYHWDEIGKVIVGGGNTGATKWINIRETKDMDSWKMPYSPLFEAGSLEEAQETADLITSLRDFYK